MMRDSASRNRLASERNNSPMICLSCRAAFATLREMASNQPGVAQKLRDALTEMTVDWTTMCRGRRISPGRDQSNTNGTRTRSRRGAEASQQASAVHSRE